jgi:polysaccharide deacetylase family protein (PEP-CTERM system associated)
MSATPIQSRPDPAESPGLRVEEVAATRPSADRPVAAFTVDVEDWYQSCVDYDAPISDRVVRNLDTMLALLDECGVKGTFFVQGRVAEAHPRAVQELLAEGHEIQSHGYSHRPLSGMDRRALRDELRRSRATVEDAAGVRVTAFRAQDFSIVSDNLWALDCLAETGFEVDSSIFPMRMKRYGIAGWPLGPHRISLEAATLLEVPVAVWARGRARFPVAGGGYFRVVPERLLERGIAAIAAAGRPPVVYCHPYEFAERELDDFRGMVGRKTLLAQGLGRAGSAARMRRLMGALPFGRFDAVLAAWGVA